MAKNKNKEKPKQNKGPTAEVQNVATDNNNSSKDPSSKKNNAGKDCYS